MFARLQQSTRGDTVLWQTRLGARTSLVVRPSPRAIVGLERLPSTLSPTGTGETKSGLSATPEHQLVLIVLTIITPSQKDGFVLH